MTKERFLPGVPRKLVEKLYDNAPGNEIGSGKFDHPESSSALFANALGYFLGQANKLPPLPRCEGAGWPARDLTLEAELRFPWRGGRHPWLDGLVTTSDSLIGIESKRFEPFRGKAPAHFSDAYWRSFWGGDMKGYEAVRDSLREDARLYGFVDAAQLVKHAFALRTEVHRLGRTHLVPCLFYLYAEPASWPESGREIAGTDKACHRREIARFASAVAGDEVKFTACSYGELLDAWAQHGDAGIAAHVLALRSRFSP